MNKYFINKGFSIVFIVTTILLLSGCGASSEEPVQPQDPTDVSPYDMWVPEFTYTNQDGQAVGLSDLEGKYWIADMIFTNCNTVCPPMTRNMVKLQEMLKTEGIENIHFVSFSVDPENDPPEILYEFGEKLGADFSNWDMLTGYDQEEIADLAYEAFKTTVAPEPDSDQFMHSTSFYLIDPNGQVIRKYSGLEQPSEEFVQTLTTIIQ